MEQAELRQLAESAAQAYQAKQFDKAETFALAALMDQPGEPLASEIMGLLRIGQKRVDDAIDYLKAGWEASPTSSGLPNLIGHAYAGKGDLATAEEYFAHATQAAPHRAKLWADLGSASFTLRHLSKARAAFTRCLEIDANNEEASAGLAQIELNKNEPARALELATRVAAGNPDHLISQHVAAKAYLQLGNPEQALESATNILQHPKAWPGIETLANEVAAEACDAIGRYDEAFSHYTAMNHGVAETHQQRIEHAREHRSYENLKAHAEMTPHLAEKAAQWPNEFDTPAPTYLIGFPRSGTSMIDRVLNSHPSITSGKGRPPAKTARKILLDPKSTEIIPTLTYEDICSFRREYWATIADAGITVPEGGRILELKPYYSQHLAFFSMVFPDAKYIFARRDPRDIVLSCFQHNFPRGIARFEFLDLERAAHYYDLAMSAGQAAREAFDLDLIEVGYEDFVADPAGEARALIDFLELPWSDEISRSIEEASSDLGSARPVSTSSAYKWCNYESHLATVRDVLDPWAEQFGYA